MVIDLGLAWSGMWAAVEAEIAAVRAAPSPVVLKVIIESAAQVDDAAIVAAARPPRRRARTW
ncbi:MAG: hypothetical protein R2711_06430 [Acidimicrobiales bacterium]